MTVRVGINGFGRIGRNYVRAARQAAADIEVVAVNDLTSATTLAYLLRYDSTHGRFPGTVFAAADTIVIDGVAVAVLAERDPKALPWGALGVDLV
ncbi:MAG: glyceraldehyde 3-phosphate dehydrogenase NAD-binding domain-containing protein, partial [Acidimicrobiales bacterium]